MKKCFFLIFLLTGCINQSTKNEMTLNQLNGQWVADGTQIKEILSIIDGVHIYADDYDLPYYLSINEDGTYFLDLNNENNQTENGTYSVVENKIHFSPENKEGFIWECELLNDNELHCENYATVFTKK